MMTGYGFENNREINYNKGMLPIDKTPEKIARFIGRRAGKKAVSKNSKSRQLPIDVQFFDKLIFKHLEIYDRIDWQTYPVIYFDFSLIGTGEWIKEDLHHPVNLKPWE
jgi:hypothetical protein